MADKKIIAVVGATGAQGGGAGSLARSREKNGPFAVRAITRKSDSEDARSLVAHGSMETEPTVLNAPALCGWGLRSRSLGLRLGVGDPGSKDPSAPGFEDPITRMRANRG